ncbi:thiamine pyrophosphokinase [Trichoderma longibrachiatum ATCC 18648]|uniref:Thiamine pyrophosphokinase n=1 Tax=Trichoderma longibrachiatum ATCC 18648 TaxID=983965 RepID=A0A2T4BVS2_TRILO|nr:thiamine pyrophosphokinase [Trichoderma longibrachiatum ATCC 18648]
MDSVFEWQPNRFLLDQRSPQPFALLVLNQPLKNGSNLRKLWRNSSLRVAADGGANRLHELSSFQGKYSNLQVIIGDLDSLRPHVHNFYTSQHTPAKIIHDTDQESTDFGKAITWIRKTQPPGTDIIALGGIGGRIDQGLSQLHHLYLFHLARNSDSSSRKRLTRSYASSCFLGTSSWRARLWYSSRDLEKDVRETETLPMSAGVTADGLALPQHRVVGDVLFDGVMINPDCSQ